MEDQELIAPGDFIKFLDFRIKNSANTDHLILLQDGPIEIRHMGFYGEATAENIQMCKRDALYLFMVLRPESFAQSLVRRLAGRGYGVYHEYFTLAKCCEKEGIEIPEEITPSNDANFMIHFNGQPI